MGRFIFSRGGVHLLIPMPEKCTIPRRLYLILWQLLYCLYRYDFSNKNKITDMTHFFSHFVEMSFLSYRLTVNLVVEKKTFMNASALITTCKNR